MGVHPSREVDKIVGLVGAKKMRSSWCIKKRAKGVQDKILHPGG